MIIEQSGIIEFELGNLTRKHTKQSIWKKTAMVLCPGEISQYYAWFLNKRYNLVLNPPQRGAHVSFINDRFDEFNQGAGSEADKMALWNQVKSKWDKKEIIIKLSLEPRSDGKYWWLNIPHEHRHELQSIRTELGLGLPFAGLHLTLGHANEKNIEHSKYIHRLLTNNLIP